MRGIFLLYSFAKSTTITSSGIARQIAYPKRTYTILKVIDRKNSSIQILTKDFKLG